MKSIHVIRALETVYYITIHCVLRCAHLYLYRSSISGQNVPLITHFRRIIIILFAFKIFVRQAYLVPHDRNNCNCVYLSRVQVHTLFAAGSEISHATNDCNFEMGLLKRELRANRAGVFEKTSVRCKSGHAEQFRGALC